MLQYDNLNRISQAWSSGPNWGESFVIDGWGNLTNRGGVAGKTYYEPLSCAANERNQLNTCFNYDAAGNMTQNGATQYVYDAENRIQTTSGVTYTYDGDGGRVKKSSGTLYWGAGPLMETSLTGAVVSEYVYFNGKRVARVDANGSVHYYFSDHLGTADVIASSTGVIEKESDYYPYGGEMPISGNDTNHFKFTGKERDSETGLDYFEARSFGSNAGRFLSPDLIGGDIMNPQSLNKYAYVINNPLRHTDPTGLYMCRDSVDCSSELDKKFEKELEKLRSSTNGEVARAAAAYGGRNIDNGVSVGFADMSDKGADGSTVSSIGADSTGVRAESQVTINSKIDGDILGAAIGHEGSHAADAQAVVRSGLTAVGEKIHAGMDITSYQSEVRAWGVTNSILSSGNLSRKFGCGAENCQLGKILKIGDDVKLPGKLGEVIDTILSKQKSYNRGGKPMGPNNQGSNVVSGVELTPRATVPGVR